MTTTINLSPAVYNIVMEQGQSVEIPFAITRAGDPFDLSGFDVRLQVRRFVNDSIVLINCTVANFKLVWTSQVGGTFKLVLIPTDTSLLRFNSGEESIDAVYDLEIVSIPGVVYKVSKGDFVINREVTR